MKILILMLSLQLSCLAFANTDNTDYDFTAMESMLEQYYVNSNSSVSCQISKTKMWKANKLFQQAAFKLTNVNNWSNLIGMPGQDFELYSGKTRLYRQAVKGDLIRIKLPLDPTRRSYWVKIESVKRESQSISIVVRPTANPFKNRKNTNITDHFFTNEATNTFSVTLVNDQIRSRVSGRNEEANLTQVETQRDGAANYTIAQMGWGVTMQNSRLGFQSLVWAKLNSAIATCD